MMYWNQYLMTMLRNLRTSSLCKKLLPVKQQLIQCHQSILQQEKSSLQEPLPSADNMDSHVSFTIPSTLISGNSTTQPSLRYRHSIGPPSLSCATIDKKTTVESNKEYFGENEEIKRFFLSEASIETKTKVEKETEIDIVSFINQAKHDFQVHTKNKQCKHIIQPDPDRFWHLLLKQTFDLSQEYVLVRFAGKAVADLGGPLRELFTLAMTAFSRVSVVIFSYSNSMSLTLIPECLIKNQYFKLGQIIGLSILRIGRGPECFNLMLVKSIFNVHFEDVLPAFTDGFLSEKIEKIQSGDKNELYEYEFHPSENIESDI